MNIDELDSLVRLVQNSNISEVTLKQGDKRVTIKKSHYALETSVSEYEVDDVFESQIHEWPEQNSPLESLELVEITAPYVGLFRHIKPIIGLGAKVSEGQTLCSIQSMDILNEVTASISGTIEDLLVDDNQPVEYGQVLYRIKADR